MNKLVENLMGRAYTLLYVGDECLLHFPTSQRAFDFLREIFSQPDAGDPEGITLALVVGAWHGEPYIPMIGEVTRDERGAIEYKELFGPPFEEFSQKIIEDWDRMSEVLATC